MTDYKVLDDPRIVDPKSSLITDNVYWYHARMERFGWETRISVNKVEIGKKRMSRAVLEGIHRERGKKIYIEFLDGKWHYAMWGELMVTSAQVYDLIDGVKEEPNA